MTADPAASLSPATDTQPGSPPPQPPLQPPSQGPAHTHEFTAEMQAEIDAAMRAMEAHSDPLPAHLQPQVKPDPHNMSVPGAKPNIRGPRVVQAGREHRHGKIVSVGPTDIFIEFGPKELGVLPRIQYPDESQLPKVGDDLEVVIDKFEANEHIYICSRPGAVQKAAWELLDAGQVIEARVSGVVNGKDGKPAGLELEVAGHRAFMPASQVGFDRVQDFSVYVGEKMKCTVVRVERMGKGNIVLSRRDILAQERKESGEKIKATLQEGQTVEGTVRKIMPFGAFVDLGGIDGLVHISDLTYDRVGFGEKVVAKYVSEGQRVNVRILKIDNEQNRIGLGLKQVAGDPFASAANSVTEGAEITGKVVRIAEFGAFVQISQGVDGLVHISEIDHKRIGKVEDALKVDEIVRAKILKIDPANRRISLSIRALKPLPEVHIGEGGTAPGEQPVSKPGPRGAFGGQRGGPQRGGKDRFTGRSAEEIMKETPALRRAREKFKQFQFRGGLG